MFRDKESSNRIELSQLVQDLLNFGVLGSLQLWGGVRWVGGVWGHRGCPTHVHMYTHTCTHTCKILQMATNMFIMIVVSSPCHPHHPHVIPVVPTSSCHPNIIPKTLFNPPPTPPPPPHLGDRDILILFEDLKSVETPPPMGGCMVWWVGGWLGGLMGGVMSNHKKLNKS